MGLVWMLLLVAKGFAKLLLYRFRFLSIDILILLLAGAGSQ